MERYTSPLKTLPQQLVRHGACEAWIRHFSRTLKLCGGCARKEEWTSTGGIKLDTIIL